MTALLRSMRRLSLGKSPSASLSELAGIGTGHTKCKQRPVCYNKGRAWWIIDPRSNSTIAYWDAVVSLALLYTAFVTPVEVGFIEPPSPSERWSTPTFLLDRVVDLVFIWDMVLQFCLGYSAENTTGKHWEFDARRVATHYVNSRWFVLDVVSITSSSFDVIGDGSSNSNLSGLRAVRVLRLVKLIRLTRGSRIFKRWEMRLSINYSHLSLLSLIFYVCMVTHWFACLWGLQAREDPLNSWLGVTGYCVPWNQHNASMPPDACPKRLICTSSVCDDNGQCSKGVMCEPWDAAYVMALYWSVMAITSVGYGDVAASAFNIREQIICSLLVLAGALAWAQLIGCFCSIASAPSPETKDFRETIQHLNSYMDAHHLPSQMRFRLREFVFESAHLSSAQRDRDLFARLSRQLHREVAWFVNSGWVKQVWYLAEADTSEREMVTELASKLVSAVFPPGEKCAPGLMYIVHRGLALRGTKVYRAGTQWGEDILLSNAVLQRFLTALAMTYLACYTLDSPTLLAVLDDHPECSARIIALRQRWLLRRTVIEIARSLRAVEGTIPHGAERFDRVRDAKLLEIRMGAANLSHAPPTQAHSTAMVMAGHQRRLSVPSAISSEPTSPSSWALRVDSPVEKPTPETPPTGSALDENRRLREQMQANHAAMDLRLQRIETAIDRLVGQRIEMAIEQLAAGHTPTSLPNQAPTLVTVAASDASPHVQLTTRQSAIDSPFTVLVESNAKQVMATPAEAAEVTKGAVQYLHPPAKLSAQGASDKESSMAPLRSAGILATEQEAGAQMTVPNEHLPESLDA